MRRDIGLILLLVVAGGAAWYFTRKRDTRPNLPPPFTYTSGVPVMPSSTPRGIRNNNPGNIRISSENWKGKIPTSKNTDGQFEQFETLEWGTRALMRNLRTYIKRGDNTLRKIIFKWAPKNENDTAKYLQFVTLATGLSPDLPVSEDHIKTISKAIIRFENGQAIPNSVIDSAFLLI